MIYRTISRTFDVSCYGDVTVYCDDSNITIIVPNPEACTTHSEIALTPGEAKKLRKALTLAIREVHS